MPNKSSSMINNKSPIEEEVEKSKKRALSRDQIKLAQISNQISSLMQQLSEYRDLYLRQRAEMDNYSKARDRELELVKRNAGMDIIKSLLPILDTMDSAISKKNGEADMRPVRDQLMKILSGYGFTEIESKGKRFDPYLHEVIAIAPSGEDEMIIEEIQKGYKLNGEVVRTSKVIVGKR